MQSETEYFRRVYEATYEDMLRYTVIRPGARLTLRTYCKTPTQGFSAA